MNKWDQWLKSKEGMKALEPSILKPGQQEYLKNRLYWAFHAGNFPITGKLETKAEVLLREVLTKPIPAYLKRKIENYLKESHD